MPYRARPARSGDDYVEVSHLGFEDALVAMSPKLERPRHLARLIEVFEAIARGEQRHVIVTVPPRFGKSETICHGIAWLQAKNPSLPVGYCTYAQRLSDRMSRKIRRLGEGNGLEFSPDENRIDNWRTTSDGGLLSTGVQGPYTGFGVGLGILDDGIKDRADADSQQVRDSTWDWLEDVFFTRLETFESNGNLILPSAMVVATRWHIDDPSGRLLAGKLERIPKWEHIHLRPINVNDRGEEESLWPARWPIAELQKIRGDGTGRTWQSLYDGNPQPEGSTMFGDPSYGEMPGVAA